MKDRTKKQEQDKKKMTKTADKKNFDLMPNIQSEVKLDKETVDNLKTSQ